MDSNIKQYYRKSENFNRYLITDKERTKNMLQIYNSNKKFFGKNILDIARGSGILGFIIEKKEHNYLGVDINLDMISNAKKYAKETKSKNKFLLGNILKSKIPGKFDTITFIGNGLAHFTTHDFLEILDNLGKNAKKDSNFIIDYRDVVNLLFHKQWKDKMIKKNKGKTTISLTTGVNFEKGEIYKEDFEKNGKSGIKFSHSIWSPFIIEPLIKVFGWRLIKRKKILRWQGWLDVYKKN